MRRMCVLLLLLSVFAVPGRTVNAQSVSGTIRESTTHTAVASAAIILLDVKGRVKGAVWSSAEGLFSIAAPSAGLYSLSVQKTGLTTIETGTFRIGDSNIVRDFEATIAPPRLATVTITDKPTVKLSGPNSHKYDEFLMRRKLGIGTFLTREQIEAKPAAQTAQLFQNIPGLKVKQHGTEWFIHSQRCPANLRNGERNLSMDADDPELYPILFVDGFRVKGLARLNDLSPSDIEGIEVYQGASQLPAVAKGNACAAVFIWLKQYHGR